MSCIIFYLRIELIGVVISFYLIHKIQIVIENGRIINAITS